MLPKRPKRAIVPSSDCEKTVAVSLRRWSTGCSVELAGGLDGEPHCPQDSRHDDDHDQHCHYLDESGFQRPANVEGAGNLASIDVDRADARADNGNESKER